MGWVGVGNMSNNVFIPYYPMLLDDMYEGYQVSTEVAGISSEKPEGFCTYGTAWVQDEDGNWQKVSGYKVYPENWRDSYYFTFEGLGGYILYAEQIDGKPVSDADKQYVLDQLSALQHEFYDEFEAMDPADTTKVGMDMARRAHELGLELIDYVTSSGTASFVDVSSGAYYNDAVLWAAEKGITGGTDATHFSPNAACTRAQAVTFLWRAAGSPAPKASSMPFTDVADDAYYRDAVLWAVENGITKGTTDTTFSPNATCTRAQIVTFLYRNVQAQGGGFTGEWMFQLPFTDTPDWAYEAIAWCYKEGITGGTTATAFAPNANCTRAQIVTFLYRSLAD